MQVGIGNDEICAEYYKTDKVKRMAVLWKNLHDQTKESPAVKAFLEKINEFEIYVHPTSVHDHSVLLLPGV